MEQKVKNIKEKILEYVNSGEVSIKPRWHFILKSTLKVVIILIILLATVYFLSFFNLVFHEKMPPRMMNFQNILNFMQTLPWLIFFLSLFLLVILELLIRKFSFVYKKPLAYSLFVLVFLVLITGFALSKLDNRFLFPRLGEEPGIPILGPMHKYYRGDFGQRYFDQKYPKNLRRDIKMMLPVNPEVK